MNDNVFPVDELDERIRLGTLLADIGRKIQLTTEEHAALNNRDRTPQPNP